MARSNLTFEDLLFIARRVGVEVVAAPSSHRGKKGKMGSVVGIVRHHTGTPETFKPTEDYPTYQVVKEGRAGLENSLSAFGLGRHRAIYVFSEFLSWHAGAWSYAGITDGNGHFLGIEAEGTGKWTAWQRDVYPRLCASALLFLGEGVDKMPRHADGAMPRGRKTDAANLSADFTAQVQHYLNNPALIPVNSVEDDVLTDNQAAQLNAINVAVGRLEVAIRDAKTGLVPRVAALLNKPDFPTVEQIAAAVVAKLPTTAGGAPITATQVADAVVDRLGASLTD